MSGSGQRCWPSCKFNMSYQCRDLKRHKCHYCLAFCSVFFIVLATLIVATIIAKGPVVFLKLSQDQVGEIDIFVTPGGLTSLYPYYSNHFINATAVRHRLDNGTETSFAWSPRKVFPGIYFKKDGLYQYGNLFLINTDEERAMSLGRDYNY